MSEPPSISLIQQVNHLPPVPTYEQSEYDVSHPHHDVHDEHDGTWLEGTFKVVRAVKLVYNPHPTGGINSLEERSSGEAPGLGGYELMFRAPVVSLPLPSSSFPSYKRKNDLLISVDGRLNVILFIQIQQPPSDMYDIRIPYKPNSNYPHNLPQASKQYSKRNTSHLPNPKDRKKAKSRFTSSPKRVQIPIPRYYSSWA
jgi:hypothetical protein